jgi:SpoVK/Ycf46/Vps4 family AAA+-type ATPase
MKAELIENLIVAHYSENQETFLNAVENLAQDEEKKGNILLASKIRNVNTTKKVSKKSHAKSLFDTTSIVSQSMTGATPRDKDSLLELYEIVESEIKLSDVIIPESQESIIEQIITEQKNAADLVKHGLFPTNRLLLCGPPGCGKTMTAYAIANELKTKIAYVRLDGLVSSYLGQTSTNLRKVFDSVKNQRIILFLDEFDAIAKKRDDSNELGELKRVVTALLQNFDNMPNNVFLIAATNHEHLLDPAIWRRFNVTVTLELPNDDQRKILMKKWLEEYKVSAKLDFTHLSKITEGLSGAQLKELMTAAVKKFLLDKSLQTENITAILLQQLTKYSQNSDDAMAVFSAMIDRGVSVRQMAKALGLAHTTLDYQLKKYKERCNA